MGSAISSEAPYKNISKDTTETSTVIMKTKRSMTENDKPNVRKKVDRKDYKPKSKRRRTPSTVWIRKTKKKSRATMKSAMITNENKKIKSKSEFDYTMEKVSPFLGEDFEEEKTFNKNMSLMDLIRNNVMMLTSHYKIENQDVINTAALALSNPENFERNPSFNNKFGHIKSSLKELEPFQRLILEEDLGKMFTIQTIKDMFSNLENLDMTANAALQSLILTTAICLTRKMPSGLKMKVAWSGLRKIEIQKRLSLLLTVSQILHQKSKDFRKLETNKYDKMHKDLLKIVSDF